MNFEHGGDVYSNEILYDFSANLNPLDMPKSVANALKSSVDEWKKYPDPYCRNLIKKIAEHENFPAKNIVCGNGAADLIYRIIQTFKTQKSVICAPSFSEYKKALTALGSKINIYYLSENSNFILDIGILEMLTESVDMLMLCSPNNPTGIT
ncbi:MAG: aminotransferase class I/II-fold pyridoxal phosphate-dependent enzyme, partial [Oscillospiraceae bacterium]|nr:aminotransferase class I/II-fold pyridoxal phosphate-dependent enzyme [Oscillospiraceae bacterium]